MLYSSLRIIVPNSVSLSPTLRQFNPLRPRQVNFDNRSIYLTDSAVFGNNKWIYPTFQKVFRTRIFWLSRRHKTIIFMRLFKKCVLLALVQHGNVFM
ncbi:MAG: hypothetical protein WAM42_24800 [Candidatus Nitrosopolaris sp.]